MKQIIPFTKDITFKNTIGDLVSISLDNDLQLKGEDLITGNFYVKGKIRGNLRCVPLCQRHQSHERSV